MQREAYGAGAVSPDDFVGADIAIEHVANPSVAEVHDVVVAAVAGKIDLSHGVGRERHRAAFLARALFIGVAPSPLPVDSCRHRTAAVLPGPGVSAPPAASAAG